ncbi:LL-diaminopimelate aminotransferase [Geoglobus sp.]
MVFELAERLRKLPPYLFAELDEMKAKKEREGVKVIDFGVGDPDLPTPPHVVEEMKRAVEKVENQKYPSYAGKYEFREAVSNFYRRRKGVEVDPENVIALIGSKEGIAHLPLAFVESGDYVLYTEPGYPVYHSSTLLAGGIPYELSLTEENGFLPDLESIPDSVARKAKIMFLNYPNNPTTAVAEMDFIKEVVDFCIDNGIILAHDAAYSEIAFDYRPRSFLEYENAMECVIEFGSLSKTYNMTGWRIGYALGNEDAVKGLLKVKTNVDSGVFNAVQDAGTAALNGDDSVIEENNRVYRERRDRLVEGLRELGFEVERPKATFYVWLRVGGSSMEFAKNLLDRAGVLVTPGVGFGKSGEGYVRFALTRDVSVIDEALRRMEGAGVV